MILQLDELHIGVIAILVAVLGVGRLTRVIVYDDFPPAVWWRIKWSEWTHDGPWTKLFLCWWCLSFWVSLVCIGWYIVGYYVPWVAWTWWVFWGALAISYAAVMVIVRDEPKE